MNKDKPFYFQNLVNEKKYEKLFSILYNITENEIELTHPNINCKIASVLYDFIILCCLYYFDKKENDTTLVLNKISEFFEYLLNSTNDQYTYSKENIENLQKIFQEIILMPDYETGKRNKIIKEIGEKLIGYYMHSMKLIFFILKFYKEIYDKLLDHENIYKKIINFICNLGGDTDTNCCIVGGVIGAMMKLDDFREDLLYEHLSFCSESQKTKKKRWIIYSPLYLGYYVIKLNDIMQNPNDRNE